MKGAFQIFKKSLYNPEFYREISRGSLKDALHYYIKITTVFTLVLTTVLAISLVPQGVRFLKEQAPILIKQNYPADLVLTVQKGQVHTNAVEPYFVPKSGGPLKDVKEVNFENLLVIDTHDPFDEKKFDAYKTFALVTQTELVTKDTNNKTTIQNLRGFPDMVISQETLVSFVEKVRGALIYLIPAGVLVTMIVLFVSYLIYLIPLLLFALIPFIFAWTKNFPLSYGDAYKMSIYAGVPGLALKTFLNMSGFFFVPAYLSFLVFVLVIIFNMREMGEQSAFRK